jgi:hypothetical protein
MHLKSIRVLVIKYRLIPLILIFNRLKYENNFTKKFFKMY